MTRSSWRTLRDDGAPAQLAEASATTDVSQSPPPAPATPPRHQPVLVAARFSHVGLIDPPPLFAPPSEPRPPPPVPLTAGHATPPSVKTAAVAETGARHGKPGPSGVGKMSFRPAACVPTPPRSRRNHL